MNISLARLRKFHEAGLNAHAALRAANDRWRAAKRGLEDARTALRIYDDSAHANSAKADRFHRERDKVQRDVDIATEAVGAADAARDHANDVWSLANSLASRGRGFAAEMGVLPADLMEA